MRLHRIDSGKMDDPERIESAMAIIEETMECKACSRSRYGVRLKITTDQPCPDCGENHPIVMEPQACESHLSALVETVGGELALRKAEGLMRSQNRIGEILGEGRRRQRTIKWLQIVAFALFVGFLLLIFYLAGGTAQS